MSPRCFCFSTAAQQSHSNKLCAPLPCPWLSIWHAGVSRGTFLNTYNCTERTKYIFHQLSVYCGINTSGMRGLKRREMEGYTDGTQVRCCDKSISPARWRTMKQQISICNSVCRHTERLSAAILLALLPALF